MKKKRSAETRKPTDTLEPQILQEEVLVLADDNFNDRNVCIVSGAGTGIGRATAIAAAANGLTTVILDINAAEAEKTQRMATEMGGRAVVVPTDLCRDEDIERAVMAAADLGCIKFVANIAGIQHIDAIEDFPMERYDLMQRLMVRAPFYLSRLTIPHMRKSGDGSGVIGNMASIHAHICTAKKTSYNIAKFGLKALSQSISAEGGGKIRSFTVSTGYVKTPLVLGQIPEQARQRGLSPEKVVSDVMMGKSRVKDMMSPIEVANLFMFGFSRNARYLVGGDLLFDGGTVLTY